jgi:uncharacterized protein YlxW (UPF0749 family)
LSALKDGDAWGVIGEDQTGNISRTGSVGIGGAAYNGNKFTIHGVNSVQDGGIIIRHGNGTQALLLGSRGITNGGTATNGDIYFDAKGSGRLFLQTNSSGLVGIGTTAPAAKLHVAGDARITTMATGTTSDGVVVVDGNGTLKKVAQSSLGSDNQKIDTLSLSGDNLQISLEGDGEAAQTVDLSTLKDGDAWGVIGEDQTGDISRTGSVGIGGAAYNGNKFTIHGVNSVQDGGIIIRHGNGTQALLLGSRGITNGGTATNGDIYFDAKGSGRLFLQTNSSGLVGIGTTAPAAKLHVAGDARITTMATGTTSDGVVVVDGNGTLKKVAQSSLGSDNQKIDTLSLSGDNLQISLEGDGEAAQTVDLSTLKDGDAWGVTGEDQTVEISRSGKTIQKGTYGPWDGGFEVMHSNGTQGILFGYSGISKGGTSTNSNFYLDSKGTGHIVLNNTATGNIGIGTTSPQTKLHVAGDARITTMATGTTSDGVVVVDGNGTLKKVTQSSLGSDDQKIDTLALSGDDLQISLEGDGEAAQTVDLSALKDGDAWGVTGENQTGNISRTGSVGIGGAAYNGNKFTIHGVNSMQDGGIIIRHGNGTQALLLGSRGITNGGTATNGDIYFDAKGSGRLFLQTNSSGLVGIGTTAPAAKLHVAGDARITTMATGTTSDGVVVVDGNGTLKKVTQSSLGSDNQKIDTLTLSGDDLQISLEGDGEAAQTVDLSTLKDGDAWGVTGEDQTVEISRSGKTIQKGTYGPWDGGFEVMHSNGTQGILFGYSGISKGGTATNSNFFLDSKGTGHIVLNNTATGNIGIGTNSPQVKLHVAGGARITTMATGISSDSVVVVDGSGNLKKVAQSSISSSSADDQKIDTLTLSGDDLQISLEGDGEAAQTVDLSGFKDGDAWGVTGENQTGNISRTGSVGIGGAAYNGNKFTIHGVNSMQDGGIIIRHGNGTQALLLGSRGITNGGTATNGDIYFDAKGSGRLFLQTNSSGRVGIGTTAPATKLHVAGNARITTMATGTTTDQVVVVDGNGTLRKVAQSSISGSGGSSPIKAYGKVTVSGTTATLQNGFGVQSTITRTGPGEYTIKFSSALSSHYIIQLTQKSQNASGTSGNDSPSITYYGQTTTQFQVRITDNDNGSTDGRKVDGEFMFTVID